MSIGGRWHFTAGGVRADAGRLRRVDQPVDAEGADRRRRRLTRTAAASESQALRVPLPRSPPGHDRRRRQHLLDRSAGGRHDRAPLGGSHARVVADARRRARRRGVGRGAARRLVRRAASRRQRRASRPAIAGRARRCGRGCAPATCGRPATRIRDDDRHGTFFQMLPSSRKYALSSVYAQMNLRDAFVQACD